MKTHSEIWLATALAIGLPSGRVFAATWYAKPTPTGTGDCSSWANACGLLTAAAAANGTWTNRGQVWVKKGTYQLTAALWLKSHVWIIGGFNGNETAASQSKPFTNLTILRGGGGLDEEMCGQAPLPIVYSKGNIDAILRGFVLENGNNPGGDYGIFCSGGAMLMINSGAKIINCTFRNNFGWMGGAVAVYGAPVIYPYAEFTNCIFHNNGRKQVGTDPQTQEPIYQYCYAGGAIGSWGGTFQLNNCLFYENYASDGAALWIHPDTYVAWLESCTVTANSARDGYGGISAPGETQNNWNFRNITNTIVQDNFPKDIGGPRFQVTRSNLPPINWWNSSHLMDADPMFVNPANDDYRIKYESPCRDAAEAWNLSDPGDLDWDGITWELPPLDLALKPRMVGSARDIGAYETSCAAPPVLDCNGNSIPDACDITEGTTPDCNNNAVPDPCDLATDPSLDCHNQNGIPDSCEAAVPKGACCTSPCTGGQTQCRCAALGGSAWGAGSCFSVCSGGGN